MAAGMNVLPAADLRIVANDARLLCGFLKRGMHPGGGHFVILSRLIGREAAVAMVLFGEELDGPKAVDPELARVTVGNFRKEVVNAAVGRDVAMQYERPAQMWSMRRTARG